MGEIIPRMFASSGLELVSPVEGQRLCESSEEVGGDRHLWRKPSGSTDGSKPYIRLSGEVWCLNGRERMGFLAPDIEHDPHWRQGKEHSRATPRCRA